MTPAPAGELRRSLGLVDAVSIGLGSMIGAGVFAVWAPAARSAGGWLILSLLIAAGIASANAMSSARLAAVHPESGGTYVYGTRQLGPIWGYLAGWCFIIGKTASCAAMAMVVGSYLWPEQTRLISVLAVVLVTGLNLTGVQRSATTSRVIVSVVLLVLAVTVVVGWQFAGEQAGCGAECADSGIGGAYGVLQAAGLLFFAFAGYARIATLGEEVRDPARIIPLAVLICVGVTFALYLALGIVLMEALKPEGLAASAAPVADLARLAGPGWMVWVIAGAAAIAALGSLLNLVLGISRTTLAMARDRYLPWPLARISPANGVPAVAEIVVGVVVLVTVLLVDLRGAIGFSSFGVLLYYAIANASALTLRGGQRLPPAIPLLGLAGCLVCAWTLPWRSVAAGAVVVLIGLVIYVVRHVGRPATEDASS